MQLEDFDFSLPDALIAQHPAPVRDGARLMVLDRERQDIGCGAFTDIVEYFRPGDLLVLNDTRVIPARLHGHKESGGKVEIFLARRLPGAAEVWQCMTRSSKPLRVGSRVHLAAGGMAEVLGDEDPPLRRVRFEVPGDFQPWLEAAGEIPLPPYIRRAATAEDGVRYQTVFAKAPGALAAPTAGLHFSGTILDRLRERGVRIQTLTLHVGLGTFLPVRVDDIHRHRMHNEAYQVPEETAAAVNAARAEGRRVIALGTTSTRTLEAAADDNGCLQAGAGQTDLFIYPGYRFRAVDALVTNFHLPQSTLLMLVAAFGGREFVLSAYRQAVAEGFRFFSYGDCMLIL